MIGVTNGLHALMIGVTNGLHALIMSLLCAIWWIIVAPHNAQEFAEELDGAPLDGALLPDASRQDGGRQVRGSPCPPSY